MAGYSLNSAAFSIAFTLRQSGALRSRTNREHRRQWAELTAGAILRHLRLTYVLAGECAESTLADTIVAVLMAAPPRPGGGSAAREAWASELACEVADALSALVALEAKAPPGFTFGSHEPPRWR